MNLVLNIRNILPVYSSSVWENRPMNTGCSISFFVTNDYMSHTNDLKKKFFDI